MTVLRFHSGIYSFEHGYCNTASITLQWQIRANVVPIFVSKPVYNTSRRICSSFYGTEQNQIYLRIFLVLEAFITLRGRNTAELISERIVAISDQSSEKRKAGVEYQPGGEAYEALCL